MNTLLPGTPSRDNVIRHALGRRKSRHGHGVNISCRINPVPGTLSNTMNEKLESLVPDAVLQECELCHNEYPIRDVEMTICGQILCVKCRSEMSNNE